MFYAILCYNHEDEVFSWSQEKTEATMERLGMVEKKLAEAGKLGPVARLMPTTAATTLRKGGGEPVVLDGPFAETKEQFLGFFIVDCASLDEAVGISKELAAANPGAGSYEIRPLLLYKPGAAAT